MENFQQKNWAGEHGNEYNMRNPQNPKDLDVLYKKDFGITRKKMNDDFLGNLNRDIKILEVGANVGAQLQALQKMGFSNLYGIEVNRRAIETSKAISKNIDIIQASGLDIPFKDNYFDLVFTSGVLIHISPSNIKKVIGEIYRCSKSYIWGFEYYADNYVEISYRGKKNMLWKTNFAKLYLDSFKDLKLVKERKTTYLNNGNMDSMFLLKKGGKNKK